MKKTAKAFILSIVFALALAAPASAHHVDGSASSADCTKVTAKYVGFNDNDKPVSEKVTVDGTTVYNKGGYTWSGSDNSHAISYPNALASGDHTIVFTATWSTQGSNNATFTKQVTCEGPSTAKVNSSASSADCTKVSARYESFDDDDKPVSEKVTVDGTTVYNKGGYTWSGSSSTHVISYPNALTPGNHTVVFTASWATQGDNNGTFTKQVSCASLSKVNTAASSADCTKVTAKYESFGDGDKPVSEKVTVDGTTVYNKGGYTWSGSNNTHTIPNGLAPGDHTVVFTATWATQGSNASSFTVRVHCEAPPAPPVSYGCDGKMVDKSHPAAVCPGTTVNVPVATVAPQGIICRSDGRLVLYTKHSKILAQRLYVDGKMVAKNYPNANSHITVFDVPDTGDSYSLRIVARLRSARTGRKFRWTKTVQVKRCGVAVARTLHIDP